MRTVFIVDIMLDPHIYLPCKKLEKRRLPQSFWMLLIWSQARCIAMHGSFNAMWPM
jgi:hypothetical protein